MAEAAPNIPKVIFQAVIGTLFGSALTAAVIRTFIRLKQRRRLYLDDGFLCIACLALIAATACLYTDLDAMYLNEEIIQAYLLGHMEDLPADMNVAAVIRRAVRIGPLDGGLSWLVLFSVKFAFLSFFHQLVNRLPRYLLYWRVVVIANAIAFLYCISYSFLECPHHGLAALQCLTQSGLRRQNIMIATGMILDVLTDILIVSIPICILWQVRIKTSQKLGIGAFLCLSICMIIIACIRCSGMQLTSSSINAWQSFWLEVEACVAVCMVSLTAFRSVFASDMSNVNVVKARPWYSSTVAKLRRRKEQKHDLEGLPAIPPATISGMRTFIKNLEPTDNQNTMYGASRVENISSIPFEASPASR